MNFQVCSFQSLYVKTWSYNFYAAPSHGLTLGSLGPAVFSTLHPAVCSRGSREADGEWACASWPVRSCPESRESRREVSVSCSWLSLCGCLELRLRTKGHCCSQGHLFHGLLLVSGSESLPTCALTRGPGSLNCYQSWAPALSFVASLKPAYTLQLD